MRLQDERIECKLTGWKRKRDIHFSCVHSIFLFRSQPKLRNTYCTFQNSIGVNKFDVCKFIIALNSILSTLDIYVYIYISIERRKIITKMGIKRPRTHERMKNNKKEKINTQRNINRNGNNNNTTDIKIEK